MGAFRHERQASQLSVFGAFKKGAEVTDKPLEIGLHAAIAAKIVEQAPNPRRPIIPLTLWPKRLLITPQVKASELALSLESNIS